MIEFKLHAYKCKHTESININKATYESRKVNIDELLAKAYEKLISNVAIKY